MKYDDFDDSDFGGDDDNVGGDSDLGSGEE
jgi:hypothetical protein